MALQRPTVSEPSLLGVWVSDGARTMEGLRARWDPPEERIGKLADLVGQMKVTVTESTITTELQGSVLTVPYTILARDAHSAVIQNDAPPDPELEAMGFSDFQVIYFDGKDGYPVMSELGGFTEYFRRVADE